MSLLDLNSIWSIRSSDNIHALRRLKGFKGDRHQLSLSSFFAANHALQYPREGGNVNPDRVCPFYLGDLMFPDIRSRCQGRRCGIPSVHTEPGPAKTRHSARQVFAAGSHPVQLAHHRNRGD